MIWKAAEGNGLSFSFGIGDDRYIDCRLRAQGDLFAGRRRWANRELLSGLSGGRAWWAHFDFTRINIAPIILRKKIEDVREAARSCLKSTVLGHAVRLSQLAA
jgi:hypothetical protein